MAADKLKMGIEAAYPPFNNKDASGQVVGFDKDIGDALCAKMKVECEVVTSDWDGIIPALLAQKFDFLISSLSVNDERKQAVDFTDPYYSNKLQFIAPKKTSISKSIKNLSKARSSGHSALPSPVPGWKTNWAAISPPSSTTPRKTPTWT
nr:hypothetical protein GCM10020185_27850 [Pseudomonas brassicacearum subsp. brassicacearum]